MCVEMCLFVWWNDRICIWYNKSILYANWFGWLHSIIIHLRFYHLLIAFCGFYLSIFLFLSLFVKIPEIFKWRTFCVPSNNVPLSIWTLIWTKKSFLFSFSIAFSSFDPEAFNSNYRFTFLMSIQALIVE